MEWVVVVVLFDSVAVCAFNIEEGAMEQFELIFWMTGSLRESCLMISSFDSFYSRVEWYEWEMKEKIVNIPSTFCVNVMNPGILLLSSTIAT